MEFPQTLEEHFYQVVKNLIYQTTTELQKLFRHHWKEIPGNNFWDIEFGTELWRSSHTQLNHTSKQRIVKGHINKWTIADLAVLLPKVMRRNGNMSLTKQYSEVLQSIQDLFAPFDKKKLFVSFDELGIEEYREFVSSLTELLTQLDTDTMTLSSITRDIICLEGLALAVLLLIKIYQETNVGKFSSLVTELSQKFPNLPPHLEAEMFTLRCETLLLSEASRHTKAIQKMSESLKMLSFDRLNIPAHFTLANFYRCEETQNNPSFLLYHMRKTVNLPFYRPSLFNFIKSFLGQQPIDEPSCVELYKGLLLMQKKGPIKINELYLAMGHFESALRLGNKLGLHAFGLGAILARDYKQISEVRQWTKKHTSSYQNAVKMLIKEVKAEPVFYKYNTGHSQREKLGQAHFLLGYQYEKGFISQDFDKAKALYQTAVTVYNNELASYFLGSMYYDGAGVCKSYMWAKLYWEHSVAMATTQREWSLFAMIDYYLKHLEFTKAEMLAMELVTEPGRDHIEQVLYLVEKIKLFKRFDLAPHFFELHCLIVDHEQTWKLSGKGLTFLERLKRVELLGFTHTFGDFIKAVYDYFGLSYGTERNSDGDGETMSEYTHGLDESLEVDYSQLFSRLYLVAPARVFTVTTFRHNLATNEHPKRNIKYKTRSRAELVIKLPNTFVKDGPYERFIVVEDPLFVKDSIYLMLEDTMTGSIQQLKLTNTKAVIRTEKHLKLEYGAKIALSYKDCRNFLGNADAYFNDTMEATMAEVIVLGKVANMCRFCADPIFKVKECVCGFRYCGQTCLEKDRKYLKHEFLCSAPKRL